jgi:hypothetical protein
MRMVVQLHLAALVLNALANCTEGRLVRDRRLARAGSLLQRLLSRKALRKKCGELP